MNDGAIKQIKGYTVSDHCAPPMAEKGTQLYFLTRDELVEFFHSRRPTE